jgi:Na+-transporting methylmalonyl-CoA/oxaloacetate decarboxylase beta subunit
MKSLNEDIHSPNIIQTSNIHNSTFTTLPPSISPNIVTSLSTEKTYHRKSRYKEFNTDNQIESIYVKVIHICQEVAVILKNCYRLVTTFREARLMTAITSVVAKIQSPSQYRALIQQYVYT